MEQYGLNGTVPDEELVRVAQKWKPVVLPLDPEDRSGIALHLYIAEEDGDISAYTDLMECAVLIFRELGNGYPDGLLDDARLFLAPNPDDNDPVQRGLAATLASIEAKQSN
ncbi:hypothetical protein [Rothia nasimurium]|uniref:hypothetical protein n=1 Tax=Rothia nasimurium TaxID=85336 RepID=UPI001F3D1D39|nr:hypothetical protein [Rothia nasimurium]